MKSTESKAVVLQPPDVDVQEHFILIDSSFGGRRLPRSISPVLNRFEEESPLRFCRLFEAELPLTRVKPTHAYRFEVDALLGLHKEAFVE